MQTRYEMDKREKENEILKHNNSIQKLELERQNLTKWRLYFGLAIISILVFFIYYRYRVKLAINVELEKRINTAMKKNKEQQQIIFHQASLTSLGELAAGMAHEINQPLQNIYLATETLEFELRESKPNQSIIVANVKDISCNLIRMRKIVDHIRVFSSKQKDEVFNDFNVKEYIDKAFLLVKKQYLKNGVKIYFDISDDKILLRGNPYKYEQIILNLLSNSRDAVIEKSKITENEFSKEIHIKIYQNANETITIVKDNGIGMLPEKITEVFVPFYTTKKLGRGSGLGMPITRNIIHEMQGSIKIESKRNEGTTVIIKFPQIINY
jgi:C4-dicarboxylate-specific signal transduction histidine kinase